MISPILTQQHVLMLEITLTRPATYNAFNLEMIAKLSDTLASTTLERQGIRECAGHPDVHEGIKAFGEKTKPVF